MNVKESSGESLPDKTVRQDACGDMSSGDWPPIKSPCIAGAKMSRETRFLMGGLFTALFFIGVPLLYKVAAMETSMVSMSADLGSLASALKTVIHDDLTDMKGRLLVMEQREILPRAAEELKHLEERIRKLENGRP